MLKTVDIGEADRFCILFTRLRGRLAARARGVRRPMSRMGGSLLPFSHVRIELAETSHSLVVTSAGSLSHALPGNKEYEIFSRLQQGAYLVLQLTEDEEPLPRVFDLLLIFVHSVSVPGCSPVLPFSICLLHILGLLPAQLEDRRFEKLSPPAKVFVERCVKSQDIETLCCELADAYELQRFADSVLGEHLKHTFKSIIPPRLPA